MDVAALTREEIDARLTGPPAERAAFVRAAAEAGHVEAATAWGRMLLEGSGVATDPRAAFDWFARAAARHDADALNMVGRCYDQGWGVRVDKIRAAECFRVAAARGLPWAMYNHATALALGDGTARDQTAALAWLERAAEEGEGLVRAKALNFVGSFAEDGWAGPVDMDRAARNYAAAAEGGDFRGCFNHARMLAAADDLPRAAGWIAAAARLGHDRFRSKMRAWLERAPEPLRTSGLEAMERPC